MVERYYGRSGDDPVPPVDAPAEPLIGIHPPRAVAMSSSVHGNSALKSTISQSSPAAHDLLAVDAGLIIAC